VLRQNNTVAQPRREAPPAPANASGAVQDWDKLRIFSAVADAGSFTHAGDVLRLSQSAISRQISALEESLNTSLFHRHARGLVLTEQGEVLYRSVRDMIQNLNAAESLIAETKERPEGQLRITTTTGLGSTWLAPRMSEFIERYPGIQVSLLTSDSDLDLTLREADVAIRITEPTQPDLVRRHLMQIHTHVYASPDYLTHNGIPKSPDDLAQHRIVAFAEEKMPPAFDNMNWLLDAAPGARIAPRLSVNSVYGIFRAVRSGIGMAALPDYMTADTDLVRVLPELEGPERASYFVYPEALRNSARVTAFRDFLLKKIPETTF
jgi:DNA-binding transcriptional LysR family regulator